jgi:hypothetical protein
LKSGGTPVVLILQRKQIAFRVKLALLAVPAGEIFYLDNMAIDPPRRSQIGRLVEYL